MCEWLVTNGLGGYASGTIDGVTTRRYHGLLIAALAEPEGRTVLLNRLDERLRLPDGTSARLTATETVAGGIEPPEPGLQLTFRLEAGLPVWRFDIRNTVIEKRIVMPHERNAACIMYRLVSGVPPLAIELEPGVHFRSHHGALAMPDEARYSVSGSDLRYVVACEGRGQQLHLAFGTAAALSGRAGWLPELEYRVEASRGYDHRGVLWTPGAFVLPFGPDGMATLVASTEPPDGIEAAPVLETELTRRRQLVAAAHPAARTGVGARLVLAADQFIVARPGGSGRTIIAGYPWFTDWGRDTMIALDGLTRATGRSAEAREILQASARLVRDGLIPNLVPEGGTDGLYNTADATLWFFHAIDRYVLASGDRPLLRELLPTLFDIIRRHVEGTRFGIGADPDDGLLRQGAAGVQLTWMDAKVGDRVVTPRRGKAVEINALWYNALRLLQGWLQDERGSAAADPVSRQADLARDSFNRRFWYADGRYLYDVVDGEQGDDATVRPNQLLAISLPHPILDRSRWESVLAAVGERLLTPFGLRSLDPAHPEYRGRCEGDQAARDGAYHQGTAWAWLLGPWADAHLAAHPTDTESVRAMALALCTALDGYGVGSIGEIFDGDAPFAARGCISQAWSVAEALRIWVRTSAPEAL